MTQQLGELQQTLQPPDTQESALPVRANRVVRLNTELTMGIGCVGKIPIMYYAHKPVLWACYAALMPVVTFGLIGNILSFRILGYNKSRRNQSSTFYLRALALADSATLVCNVLLMAQQMMLRPALNLHPLNFLSLLLNSHPMCNIRMYFSHTTTLIAVYIIVLFSIERALVVINPFRWMRFFSLRKAKAAVLALALTGCLICIPSMFSFNKERFMYPKRLYNVTTNATILAPTLLALANCSRLRRQGVNATGRFVMEEPMAMLGVLAQMAFNNENLRMDDNISSLHQMLLTRGDQGRGLMKHIGLQCQYIAECRINFPLFKQFIMFHNLSLSLVPFIVTGVCNFIILMSLRQAETKNLRKSKPNDVAQDRQVTKKLIIVSTAFVVLSFPMAVFHLITGAMEASYCSTFWANFMTIAITLNSANYAVNFIIYCISEEQFRRLVWSVLMCKRHRLTRLLSYINEPKNRGGGGGRGAKGRSRRGNGGTGTSLAGGGRKFSNAQTNVTSYSVTQGPDQSELSVTDALVHQQGERTPTPPPQDEEEDAVTELSPPQLREKTLSFVKRTEARRQNDKPVDDGESKPHDFKNCSLVRDDWASELFADDVEDGRLRAVMARWSEVAPE